MQAFSVFWQTLKYVWEELLLLSLFGIVTAIATITIILAPGAWAALYVMCNRVAHGYAISWSQYWDAFKSQYRQWLPMCALAAIVSILVVFNIWWYPRAFEGASWVPYVQGAWIAASLFFTAILFYVFPFFVAQEVKSWRTALRNAAIVGGANPLFTTISIALTVTLLGLVTFVLAPLAALLGCSFWALSSTTATLNRVRMYRKRMGLPATDDE